MEFTKDQIKTKEFRDFVKKALVINIKESCEDYLNKTGYYPLYLMVNLWWIGNYTHYNKEKDKYSGKLFGYRKIIDFWAYSNESLDIDHNIDEIIIEVDESLYTKKFKNEFYFCGNYENKELIDLYEYVDHIRNVRDKMIEKQDKMFYEEYDFRSNK